MVFVFRVYVQVVRAGNQLIYRSVLGLFYEQFIV